MTQVTYTPSQITAIAHECAGFAHDNYDREDTDGLNSALTPESIWNGWHDKDGVEAPPMPASFELEYMYQLERTGGSDFRRDIQALIVVPMTEAKTKLTHMLQMALRDARETGNVELIGLIEAAGKAAARISAPAKPLADEGPVIGLARNSNESEVTECLRR